MLRDITIGQFYPVRSPIHALDPRTKLAGTMLYLLSLFMTDSVAGYVIATVFLVSCIKLSKVPFRFMVKGLKAIILLLVLSVSFNLFLTPGTTIFELGFIHISMEGLLTAGFMAIRLIYLVIGSSLMTLTTTPNALTDGLERSLGFMKRFGVPVHEIAMMMSIALRFIPILVEETDKIMKAQSARGADFERGGLIQKAKAMVPLLVPLFISAFRRAADLAMAMEARCYHGGEGRTKMHPLRYTEKDRIAYIILFIYFALMALTNLLPF
ncbi:MAG TPA: energy-coupling factor transporter transmembrane protein EcfT [Candidatus Avilachnospira avistercoris]|nr:energy-coupling factor transporter transmembrane protein EcfT [Candidatus Avilachnospira avistercoris]